MKPPLLLVALLCAPCHAQIPRDALPVDSPDWPVNYRLHVEFSKPSAATVRFAKNAVVKLPVGTEHDVAVEYPSKG